MRVSEAVAQYISIYNRHDWHSKVNDANPIIRGMAIPYSIDRMFTATEVVSHGRYAVAVLLSSGDVLKLNQKAPLHKRFFDAPILCAGREEGIDYLVQPFLAINQELDVRDIFDMALRPKGYILVDTPAENIGFTASFSKKDRSCLPGLIGKEVYLVDPDAVIKYDIEKK